MPYIDRTSEFLEILNGLKYEQELQQQQQKNTSKPKPKFHKDNNQQQQQSVELLKSNNNGFDINNQHLSRKQSTNQFYSSSSKFARELEETASLIQTLTKMVRQRSPRSDNTKKIQELTAELNNRIASHKDVIGQLQQLQEKSAKKNAKQPKEHYNQMVSSLKTQLMDTTKSFKDVLTLRKKSIKHEHSRRSRFSYSSPRVGSMEQDNGQSNQIVLDMSEMGMQQEQIEPDQTQSYLQGRTDAVRMIESNISELSNMYSQLSDMITRQDEMVLTVHSNVEQSLEDIEHGHMELTDYFQKVVSNRSFILKVFFVLVVFLIFFVLFVVK